VWGAQAARDPVLVSDHLRELLGWYEAGRLRPRISATFPLIEAPAAMKALLGRDVAGKIVLTT
jgi:NADPH2:quinone reductase